MCDRRLIFGTFFRTALLIWISFFVIDQLQFSINHISLFILPFCINVFDPLHKNSRTIFMVKIIFLKCKHLLLIFTMRIPSFKILLGIANILDILVNNVVISTFFLYNIINYISIEIYLGRRVFSIHIFHCYYAIWRIILIHLVFRVWSLLWHWSYSLWKEYI